MCLPLGLPVNGCTSWPNGGTGPPSGPHHSCQVEMLVIYHIKDLFMWCEQAEKVRKMLCRLSFFVHGWFYQTYQSFK